MGGIEEEEDSRKLLAIRHLEKNEFKDLTPEQQKKLCDDTDQCASKNDCVDQKESIKRQKTDDYKKHCRSSGSSKSSCFAPFAKAMTANGAVQMGDLQTGDLVQTQIGLEP